jgi:hypothetical protein
MIKILLILFIHLFLILLIVLSNTYVQKSKLATNIIKENKYLHKSFIITLLSFIGIFLYSKYLDNNQSLPIIINFITTGIIFYYPLKKILYNIMDIYISYEVYNNNFENICIKKVIHIKSNKQLQTIKNILFGFKLIIFLISVYILIIYIN